MGTDADAIADTLAHLGTSDLRAGASVEAELDLAAGPRIACPVLVVWAGRGALPRFHGDVLSVRRPWSRTRAARRSIAVGGSRRRRDPRARTRASVLHFATPVP